MLYLLLGSLVALTEGTGNGQPSSYLLHVSIYICRSRFVLVQFPHCSPILYSTFSFSYQTNAAPSFRPTHRYDLDCPFPALMKLELHSSYALPAPKPRPTKAGHARRLKMRTEKTTPKDRPRDERMRRDERQRSHYRARSAQALNFALTRSNWLGVRGDL